MQQTLDTSSRQEHNCPFLHSVPQGSNISFPEPVTPKQCPPKRRRCIPLILEHEAVYIEDWKNKGPFMETNPFNH